MVDDRSKNKVVKQAADRMMVFQSDDQSLDERHFRYVEPDHLNY